MVYLKHYSVRHDDIHLMGILTNGILSAYLVSGTALVYKIHSKSLLPRVFPNTLRVLTVNQVSLQHPGVPNQHLLPLGCFITLPKGCSATPHF